MILVGFLACICSFCLFTIDVVRNCSNTVLSVLGKVESEGWSRKCKILAKVCAKGGSSYVQLLDIREEDQISGIE